MSFTAYDNEFKNAKGCFNILRAYELGLTAADDILNHEPYPILFTGDNCPGSTRVPSSQTQLSDALSSQGYAVSNINSLYVPFNFRVILSGPSTVTLTGPYISVGGSDFQTFTLVKFQRQKPWAEYVADFCFGIPYSFGTVDLTDILSPDGIKAFTFTPQSGACDGFMEQTYCVTGSTYFDLSACGCFRDQESLKEQYPSLDLSVICFGKRCAHGGYQTAVMRQKQCSPAICGEVIRTHAGTIYDTGVANIYCNSEYFPVPSPDDMNTSSPTPAPSSSKKGLSRSVAIVVGVLVVVIAIFIAGTVGTFLANKRNPK